MSSYDEKKEDSTQVVVVDAVEGFEDEDRYMATNVDVHTHLGRLCRPMSMALTVKWTASSETWSSVTCK